MNDTISRKEAIALAKDLCVPTKDGTVYKHRCIDPDEIRELPSVQPERMRGKWIAYDGNVYMCSCCGRRIITNPDYIKEQKFCFRCGADMRGTE